MSIKITQKNSLSYIFNKSIISVSVLTIAILLLVTVYITNKSNKRDIDNYYTNTNGVLRELIKPALEMSNYMEIQKLIGLASGKGEIISVISSDGDVLLSDYSNYGIADNIKQYLNNSKCAGMSAAVEYRGINYRVYCQEINGNSVHGQDDELAGILVTFAPTKSLLLSPYMFVCLAGISFLSVAILITALRFILKRRILKPIEKLTTEIIEMTGMPLKKHILSQQSAKDPDEISSLIISFNRLLKNLKEAYRKASECERHSQIAEVTAQVVHDIRSPMTALRAVSSDLPELPEDKRLMLRNAMNRIEDITNDLARKGRIEHDMARSGGHAVEQTGEEYLVTSLISQVISEKRLQLKYDKSVDIRVFSEEATTAFAAVQAGDFKRVISNIINNSIEALNGRNGEITVYIVLYGNNLIIRIGDNGKGIPGDILANLTNKGVTYGKEGGHGLGLYHARNVIKKWGGTIAINSELGIGTDVTITLPKADLPAWFASEITVTQGSHILILDDDPSIHDVWRSRLNSIKDAGLTIHHCYRSDEISQWCKNCNGKEIKFIVLSDFELLGDNYNGLQIIENLNIQSRSILVTSKYEERLIREQCMKMGIKILPKEIAVDIPIRLLKAVACKQPHLKKGKKNINALLLNDDNDLRCSFNMMLRGSNVHLIGAANVPEAVEHLTKEKIDVILSDINLGEGEPDGYEFLKKVREKDSSIPFYFVSGYSEKEEGARAKKSGANGYLQLPLSKEQLMEVIQ